MPPQTEPLATRLPADRSLTLPAPRLRTRGQVPAKEETQGRTDRYIGSWLRGVKREDVTIATKVCGYSDRLRWFREAEGQPTRVSAAQIAESVDRSLARLGTDYIDLLQLHWPDRYVPLFGAGAYDAKEHRQDTVPIEEQLEALARLRDAGKVKFVGLSNETSFGVMRFVGAAEASQNASLPRVVSIQNAYSLNVRGAFETDLVETCAPHNCNVSLLAYSPLAGGTLTGKYLEDESDPRARMNAYTNYMNRYRNQRAREATAAYVALARAHGLTPTQVRRADRVDCLRVESARRRSLACTPCWSSCECTSLTRAGAPRAFAARSGLLPLAPLHGLNHRRGNLVGTAQGEH